MSYPYLIPPRISQRSALKLIYRMKRVGLFFDLGTGKTKIALDFIGAMLHHKKIGSALAIVPLCALDTWEDEIAKNWNPEFTYSLLRPDRKESDLWRESNLVIVNYDYARIRQKELKQWAPDVIVIDESHRIKNPCAKQSKMAHRLGVVCRYAICLTGTPVGNHPLDLWSQFQFLKPGLLESKFKDFKSRYAIFGGYGGYEFKKYKNLKQLAKLIGPYVRSLKKSELAELKNIGKIFIETPVEMGEEARQKYKEMEKDFVTSVQGKLDGPHFINAPIALAKLTKLSQISGGFIRDTELQEEFPLHRAKLDALGEITNNLIASDVKRVIVYARFLWELSEIKKLLAPKWSTYQISGQVTRDERRAAISLFNEGGGAMICQIASGSASMNLQSANYEVFYSLDYSHINFLQAQDRIHRLGQTKPCFYYVLMCKGTLDRTIYRLLKEKKNIADEIITLVKEAQGHDLRTSRTT